MKKIFLKYIESLLSFNFSNSATFRLTLILGLFIYITADSFAQNCFDNTHSTNACDNWLTCTAMANPNPARGNGYWLHYDFGTVYSLTTTHFWNYNVAGQTNAGMRDIIIDYSLDGINWTQATTFTLAQASGNGNYTGTAGPDLTGITARYVLLTASSNWGNSCTGLAEVRFDLGQNCTGVTVAFDSGLPTFTSANTPVTLTATPSGGVFSGTGVVFSVFNPSIAGPGLHTITYTYNDGNGCTAIATHDILVFTLTFNFVNYNLGTISPKLTDGLVLEMEVPQADRYTFEFFDLMGRSLFHQSLDLNLGLHQQEMKLKESIGKGMYLFQYLHPLKPYNFSFQLCLVLLEQHKYHKPHFRKNKAAQYWQLLRLVK